MWRIWVRKPHKAVGCRPDMRSPLILTLALPLLMTLGCATNKDAAVPLVRVRAEKDLKCPPDQITVRSKIGGKYLASGCGRTAIYDSACEGLKCSVSLEDEEAPGWRDRPDPGTLEGDR